MSEQTPIPIPRWAWVLAALFFPPGVFVAFGRARLLSWSQSIILALLSEACIIGFVQAMAHLEHSDASEALLSVTLSAGILIFSAWGLALYRIGHKASYWSVAACRIWRGMGWLAAAFFALSLIRVALQIVRLCLPHP